MGCPWTPSLGGVSGLYYSPGNTLDSPWSAGGSLQGEESLGVQAAVLVLDKQEKVDVWVCLGVDLDLWIKNISEKSFKRHMNSKECYINMNWTWLVGLGVRLRFNQLHQEISRCAGGVRSSHTIGRLAAVPRAVNQSKYAHQINEGTETGYLGS